MNRQQLACRCPAYRFPHRPASSVECIEHPDYDAGDDITAELLADDNRQRAADINLTMRAFQ